MAFCFYLRIVSLLLICPQSEAWWFFSEPPKSISASNDEKFVQNGPIEIVKFETLSAEDKFLAIAKEYLDLPDLDKCQHMVMDALKKACNDITEEELAKLSVALLNCQSQSEDRPTFDCTADMSIAECTTPMDSNTWNAYHIISNRARSVCYATRQQQFRRRTELAVNRLSQATQEQVVSMDGLRHHQEQLHRAARDSLEGVRSQQQQLTSQHRSLSQAQSSLQGQLLSNLDQLAREKSVIAQSQDQLLLMTESVLSKLENATGQVMSQSEVSKDQHKELLRDMGRLKDKAKQVWDKMDESMAKLSSVQEETTAQYQRTLEDLRQINRTVHYILRITDSLDYAVNQQLSWLVEAVGGAASGLEAVVVLGGHAAFLLLAALVLIFVQAPALPRLSLLLLVVGNSLCALQWSVSLDLLTLAALLAALTAGDWTVGRLRGGRGSSGLFRRSIRAPAAAAAGSTPPPGSPEPDLSYTPSRLAADHAPRTSPTFLPMDQSSCADTQEERSELGSEDLTYDPMDYPPPLEDYGSFKTHVHHGSVPARPTPSTKAYKCQAITRIGAKCRCRSLRGSPFCSRHSNVSVS